MLETETRSKNGQKKKKYPNNFWKIFFPEVFSPFNFAPGKSTTFG